MPTPPLMEKRCRAVHALLIETGHGGQEIVRASFERSMMQAYGLARSTTRQYVDLGSVLGLWEVRGLRARREVSESSGHFGPPRLYIFEGPAVTKDIDLTPKI